MAQPLKYPPKEMLKAIIDYIELEGYPPSIRELRELCNISTTSIVSYKLDQLEASGHITRKKGVSRAIRILKRVY